MKKNKKPKGTSVETLASGRIVLHLGDAPVKTRNEGAFQCRLLHRSQVHVTKKRKGEKHRKDYRRDEWQ